MSKKRKSNLFIGRQWANVTVTGSEEQWKIVVEEEGFRETRRETCWFLQCTCGKRFKLWASDYHGIRHLKDCGCGVSQLEGNYTLMSINMTAYLRQALTKYAAKKNIPVSAAVRDLLRKGLKNAKS